MGDEVCEPVPLSQGKTASDAERDAISDAIVADAELRELVRLWSFRVKETKDIISMIVKSRSS